MLRQSRLLVLGTALAVGVLAAGRASAEEASPSLRDAAATYSFSVPADSSFLVSHMTPRTESTENSAQGGGGGGGEGFGIGVKGGFLFNSINSATASVNNNTGWIVGLWFGGNRSGRVGVMGEIMYARKSAATADLDYLEIPILIRINIGSSSKNGLSFYALVGPSFDIKLKEHLTTGNINTGTYQSLDIGIIAGGGLEFARFLVEGQYNWGLKNVLDSTNAASVQDIRTRAFAVMVGLRFN